MKKRCRQKTADRQSAFKQKPAEWIFFREKCPYDDLLLSTPPPPPDASPQIWLAWWSASWAPEPSSRTAGPVLGHASPDLAGTLRRTTAAPRCGRMPSSRSCGSRPRATTCCRARRTSRAAARCSRRYKVVCLFFSAFLVAFLWIFVHF